MKENKLTGITREGYLFFDEQIISQDWRYSLGYISLLKGFRLPRDYDQSPNYANYYSYEMRRSK